MAFDDQEQNQDDAVAAPWQRKLGYTGETDEQQATSEQSYGRNPEMEKAFREMMAQYRTMPGPNGEYYQRVYPQAKAEPSTGQESNESMFRQILKKARTGDFSPGSRLMEMRDPNAVGSGSGYWPYQHGIFSTFYPGGEEAMLGPKNDNRDARAFPLADSNLQRSTSSYSFAGLPVRPSGSVEPGDQVSNLNSGFESTIQREHPGSSQAWQIPRVPGNREPADWATHEEIEMPTWEAPRPTDEEDADRVKQPPTTAGPAESDQIAWNAFMQDLDSKKVGDYTLRELANVLTNESRDLSFIGPSVSLFDNDLDQAKYVQAHAIINNALRTLPNKMANRTVTEAAAASRGHERDIAIMRQAYFDRMTRGADPAQGRTYFGNSADLILKSSPIGNSRHTVFARFGPFALGSQKPRYIYIYNDAIPRTKPKKGKY